MKRNAFSLIEVTIALGIIAFCVISIFALLPIGLDSVKQAKDNRNAVEIMNVISRDLLSSRLSPGGQMHLSGQFTNVSWSVGGGTLATNFPAASDGRQSLGASDESVQVWLNIIPPPDQWSSGEARISVAWPSSAQRSGNVWTKARGSVETVVYFNP